MKPLFNDKYKTYNDDGRELTYKTERALKDIVSNIDEENIDIYQAENIMISTIGIMFCELRLTSRSSLENLRKEIIKRSTLNMEGE